MDYSEFLDWKNLQATGDMGATRKWQSLMGAPVWRSQDNCMPTAIAAWWFRHKIEKGE